MKERPKSQPALRTQAKKPDKTALSMETAERFLMPTYRRPPVVFTHGQGCYLYDSAGRKYLDFLGGIAVNALGYSHPRLVRVMRRQAGRAVHVSNLFHHLFQGPLAEKLAQWSGMDRVFFTNSGSEAIEGALKFARIYAKKQAGDAKTKARVLALENGFHGRTFGALSATFAAKYREPFAPLVPGFEFIRFNDVADLEAKFDEAVCAILVETIQGEGGIYALSEAFWQHARALATKYGAALIADEIQCGLGRTGRRFAYQKFAQGDWPDMVAVAKPLAGGLPLGAILGREKFAAAISPGLHGTTFGGGPLVCASALEFLKTLEEEEVLENVQRRSAELRAGLEKLALQFDFIREIRGEGLMLGVELDREGAPAVEQALREGLIINCTHENTLRLLPPLIVREAHLKEFFVKFGKALAAVQKTTAKAAVAPAGNKAQAALAAIR